MNPYIVPIVDLFEKKFFVPAYQRGYRWQAQQVQDLLNDIHDFSKNPKGGFYCLQPLVVKKCDKHYKHCHNLDTNSEWYEVIDGQQRLTTVFLLLIFMIGFVEEYKGILDQSIEAIDRNRLFELNYETRDGSKKFLSQPTKDEADKYMDFFYIFQAFDTIKNWRNEKRPDAQTFFNTLIKEKKVQFIWYEVNENIDGVEIFTRINAGKIPLTNAELIKSLFLNQTKVSVTGKYQEEDSFRNSEIIGKEIDLEQLRIASQWDKIETELQNDLFWSFIYSNINNEYDTRIEYIFDLMVGKNNNEDDTYYTFRKISEEFTNAQNDQYKILYKKWQEVKKTFHIFEEWYDNHEMYHLIGYIVNIGISDTSNLIKEYKRPDLDINTKDTYIEYLRNLIKDYISNKSMKEKDLESLSFEHDKKIIKEILLLHNLETIISEKTSYPRFPFEEYKKDIWSIEHIHARNSDDIKEEETLIIWIDSILPTIIDEQLCDKIKQIKDENSNIKERVNKIVGVFGKIDTDSLGNLSLLKRDDNSKLSNDIFPRKRYKVIEIGKNGAFIPPCTRNVFLKYYSSSRDHVTNHQIKWEEADGDAYVKDIETKLQVYLYKDNGGMHE